MGKSPKKSNSSTDNQFHPIEGTSAEEIRELLSSLRLQGTKNGTHSFQVKIGFLTFNVEIDLSELSEKLKKYYIGSAKMTEPLIAELCKSLGYTRKEAYSMIGTFHLILCTHFVRESYESFADEFSKVMNESHSSNLKKSLHETLLNWIKNNAHNYPLLQKPDEKIFHDFLIQLVIKSSFTGRPVDKKSSISKHEKREMIQVIIDSIKMLYVEEFYKVNREGGNVGEIERKINIKSVAVFMKISRQTLSSRIKECVADQEEEKAKFKFENLKSKGIKLGMDFIKNEKNS